MKKIPLTRNLFALVDDSDFESVSKFCWFAYRGGRGWRAGRQISKPEGGKKIQHLHSFLLPGVSRIDHRDGNALNNQRENLRPATHSQNLRAFQHKAIGASSCFRGVCWDKRRKKWLASIKFDGKLRYLGRFQSERVAAKAYDIAAIKFFGEFASPNFSK